MTLSRPPSGPSARGSTVGLPTALHLSAPTKTPWGTSVSDLGRHPQDLDEKTEESCDTSRVPGNREAPAGASALQSPHRLCLSQSLRCPLS